eukprot:2208250-Rhodomonas_salina.2
MTKTESPNSVSADTLKVTVVNRPLVMVTVPLKTLLSPGAATHCVADRCSRAATRTPDRARQDKQRGSLLPDCRLEK